MRVAVVEREINPAALLREVAATDRGASVLFVGTVRDINDGRDVNGLEYTAYASMAERELAVIVTEAMQRWRGAEIVCEHRVGSLTLGDVAVVVAAAHGHRAEAFDACRYVIEELKKRVPIWKREHYADGDAAWVESSGGVRRGEAAR